MNKSHFQSTVKSHPKVASGFTLIELLVVIAIIAILAAILFPVFARARENARRSSCQSNLKQIGLGILQYTQDYDEYLPNGANWAEQTFPYVKSTQIYKCPSDSYEPSNATWPAVSYAMNDNFRANFGTTGPRSLASLNATALTVYAAEVTKAHSYNSQMGGSAPTGVGLNKPIYALTVSGVNEGRWATGVMGGDAPVSGDGTRTPTVTTDEPRHLSGANFLAADGHVKWFRGEKVSPGQDAYASGNAQGAGNAACAAGTESMKDSAGNAFALTYSLK